MGFGLGRVPRGRWVDPHSADRGGDRVNSAFRAGDYENGLAGSRIRCRVEGGGTDVAIVAADVPSLALASGAVAVALQHTQVLGPWTDRLAVLVGQNSRDLMQVREVVGDPR